MLEYNQPFQAVFFLFEFVLCSSTTVDSSIKLHLINVRFNIVESASPQVSLHVFEINHASLTLYECDKASAPSISPALSSHCVSRICIAYDPALYFLLLLLKIRTRICS